MAWPRNEPDPPSLGAFADAFWVAMLNSYEKHGADAIRRLREQNPTLYLQLCARLAARLPKATEDPPSMTEAQLEAALREMKP